LTRSTTGGIFDKIHYGAEMVSVLNGTTAKSAETMWENVDQGKATFRINGWSLQVKATSEGVFLEASLASFALVAGRIAFSDEQLPPITEAFVRGDELHLMWDRVGSTKTGLALVVMVILADADSLVVESTVSIQTELLDVYPEVTLSLPGTGSAVSDDRRTAKVIGRTPEAGKLAACVFVDERDQLSLSEVRQIAESIVFFGDFMEKGVIRKVQPWWVWCDGELSDSQRDQIASHLSERPLPLAS
jgi:hypothetical protein